MCPIAWLQIFSARAPFVKEKLDMDEFEGRAQSVWSSCSRLSFRPVGYAISWNILSCHYCLSQISVALFAAWPARSSEGR